MADNDSVVIKVPAEFPAGVGSEPVVNAHTGRVTVPGQWTGADWQAYHEASLSVSDDRPDLLERYLRKCILDDSVDVQTFFRAELQEFHDEEQRQYRILQSVNFVVVRR